MVKLICPECGKPFFWSGKDLIALKESIKRNPNLKLICSPCGTKTMIQHELEKRKK